MLALVVILEILYVLGSIGTIFAFFISLVLFDRAQSSKYHQLVKLLREVKFIFDYRLPMLEKHHNLNNIQNSTSDELHLINKHIAEYEDSLYVLCQQLELSIVDCFGYYKGSRVFSSLNFTDYKHFLLNIAASIKDIDGFLIINKVYGFSRSIKMGNIHIYVRKILWFPTHIRIVNDYDIKNKEISLTSRLQNFRGSKFKNRISKYEKLENRINYKFKRALESPVLKKKSLFEEISDNS